MNLGDTPERLITPVPHPRLFFVSCQETLSFPILSHSYRGDGLSFTTGEGLFKEEMELFTPLRIE